MCVHTHLSILSTPGQVYKHMCVCLYVQVYSVHVFIDTGITVGWENPLGFVYESVLLDVNIVPMCNYYATQIVFFLMEISARSETF